MLDVSSQTQYTTFTPSTLTSFRVSPPSQGPLTATTSCGGAAMTPLAPFAQKKPPETRTRSPTEKLTLKVMLLKRSLLRVPVDAGARFGQAYQSPSELATLYRSSARTQRWTSNRRGGCCRGSSAISDTCWHRATANGANVTFVICMPNCEAALGTCGSK
jgi:hypothetical protein